MNIILYVCCNAAHKNIEMLSLENYFSNPFKMNGNMFYNPRSKQLTLYLRNQSMFTPIELSFSFYFVCKSARGLCGMINSTFFCLVIECRNANFRTQFHDNDNYSVVVFISSSNKNIIILKALDASTRTHMESEREQKNAIVAHLCVSVNE